MASDKNTYRANLEAQAAQAQTTSEAKKTGKAKKTEAESTNTEE